MEAKFNTELPIEKFSFCRFYHEYRLEFSSKGELDLIAKSI